jgi:hypothetical protein
VLAEELRGGVAGSSEDRAVMGPERRGCVVEGLIIGQPRFMPLRGGPRSSTSLIGARVSLTAVSQCAIYQNVRVKGLFATLTNGPSGPDALASPG